MKGKVQGVEMGKRDENTMKKESFLGEGLWACSSLQLDIGFYNLTLSNGSTSIHLRYLVSLKLRYEKQSIIMGIYTLHITQFGVTGFRVRQVAP